MSGTYENCQKKLETSTKNPKNYQKLHKNWYKNFDNIAGRPPENIRNSFVDLQSQKASKRSIAKKGTSFYYMLDVTF